MLLFFVILREYIQIQHSQTRCKHARPKWIAYFALYLDLLNIYFYNFSQKLRTILKSHFYSIFNVPLFQFIQVNSYPNWIQMSFECTRASESGYWTLLFAHPKIRLGFTPICMKRQFSWNNIIILQFMTNTQFGSLRHFSTSPFTKNE